MPRKVLRDTKKRGAFPFVHVGIESVHARTEVIARDTQANVGYVPHASSAHVETSVPRIEFG